MQELKSKLTPLNFIRLSTLSSFITGLVKLFTGFFSRSYFLITYGTLAMVMSIGKLTTVFGVRFEENKVKDTLRQRRAAAFSILVIGTLFFAFSLYNYTTGTAIYYNLIHAILIGACAFTKLSLGIYGVYKYSGEKSSSLFMAKLLNITDAAISLSITQSAILSARNMSETYVYDGIIGMITGCAIITTSLILLFNIKKHHSDNV